MYNGYFSQVKTFSEGALNCSRVSISLSVLLMLFYLWGIYISKPVDLSSLTKIEGVVVEKLSSRGKYGNLCSLRIKTNKIKRYQAALSDCKSMYRVPVDQKITALVDFSWVSGLSVYQIYRNDKLIFTTILSKEEKESNSYLQFKLSIGNPPIYNRSFK